jgi:aryl-alcohol dehydrogenase-like predicted oxidoreductase
MRYRPFGNSGKAVSAMSLLLREAPGLNTPLAWRGLLFSALENGVNTFEICANSEVLALGVGETLRAVERRLVFLSWRLRGDGRRPVTADLISQSVRSGLQRTGAGYFDLLLLDEQAFVTLTDDGRTYLGDLCAAGLCYQIGVAGEGPAIDQCISGLEFEALAIPFNLTSDWKARRRLKDSAAASMTVIGYDAFPHQLIRSASARAPKPGLFRKTEPLAGAGTYAFLHETQGWTAEELCLAYALTEPAFATIQVEAFRPEAIERLAAVTDRDLPTGVAAQIEMARFGEGSTSQTSERRRA